MAIIQGTTPTIKFTFTEINPAHIDTAFLVIKQNNDLVIEKPLEEANIGEASIDWVLTQEESLKLAVGKNADICCDWKLRDGTRGRSKKISEWVEPCGKNEVI